MYFILFASLLGGLFQKKEVLFVAATSAILFALHPVHTEVVANIKGRDEILALLLCLWSAYFAIKGTHHKKYGQLIIAAIFFFLAMLAKEVSVGFLVVVPLAYYLFRASNLIHSTIALSPLLIGFASYLVLRISVLGFSMGDPPPLELMNNPFLKFENGHYRVMTSFEKMPQIIYGLGKYIQLSILPHTLTHDYYPHHLRVDSMADWKVLSSLITMFLAFIWALKNYQRNNLIFFSIAFFTATLLITANIIFPVGTHLSERFLFSPSLGVCMLLAYLIFAII